MWEIRIYLRENADEWLNMIARNGVTNESPWFVSHLMKKPLRIESGQITVPWGPPPVDVTQIRPSIFHAVLMWFNHIACLIGVSWTWWVCDPIPSEYVTLHCLFICLCICFFLLIFNKSVVSKYINYSDSSICIPFDKTSWNSKYSKEFLELASFSFKIWDQNKH